MSLLLNTANRWNEICLEAGYIHLQVMMKIILIMTYVCSS